MVVFIYEIIRRDEKVPRVPFIGRSECVFLRRQENCLNINSDATERQPGTPAILQKLIEARKVHIGRNGV